MKRDLEALAGREHDVLVVGGGIHGAAAAWDAAHRGLATALVEARDFGSGASWNSLKTVHGGLRHLQRLDVAGLRESMRERRALLTIAPGLVRPLPILVPAYGHGARGREALAVGLALNDWLTPDRNLGVEGPSRVPRGRLLGPNEVRARLPGLAGAGLSGGALFWDAQASSTERLLVGFLHSAAGAGATLANGAEVIEVLRTGDRVVGVRVRDDESGGELEIRARHTLIAAGSGAERLWRLAGLRRPAPPQLEARNLVLDGPPPADVAVGARHGGRFLFLVPWAGVVMLGTDYAAPGAAVPVEEFLAAGSAAFPWAGLDRRGVRVVHRGSVPGRPPADLASRHRIVDHELEDGIAGLVSVLSVKYTTARRAAEQALDLVASRTPRALSRCRTAVLPLAGLELPSGDLARNARHAIREEMARSLTDLAQRRLDLATAGPATPADVETLCGVLAEELGLGADALGAQRQALAAALGSGASTAGGQ